MAAGHGGQILLSLATEELVRDHLPAAIALRDMGERRLKDLIRPERVFQVIAPDLPADFPPLKTLDARPNNLPAQTTPFIGREHGFAPSKKQLSNADVRLLTLSGVGGTGKTRLALQAAADMVDEFEHGVFFVPLAALSDPALVLPTIAATLGVRDTMDRPLLEQLQDYLREKQMLLVLDNFEQVIDAAPRISDLLTVAPRLKVMVTSREMLRLYGETDYPVSPLSLPDPKQLPPLERLAHYDAVALFLDRAVAVNPAFALTDENAQAVAEICYRLDGLPLAIELAAARVRVLPPQGMLAELTHRLSFLIGGPRDLPARQQTLRGAIDWSHALLTGVEQQLFRRLSVFVGGCTLDAIQAVCKMEADLSVLGTVESLVGKSLVKQTKVNGEPRFAMLETIREYALEQLVAAAGEGCVRDRHRDYFLALAEDAEPKLIGTQQAAWLHRLEEEHDNLRAGLDWSLAEGEGGEGLRLCGVLRRFWWTRGYVSEGRDWCARMLKKAEGGERTLERAKALSAAGGLAYIQGDYQTAQALETESLGIWRQLGDREGIARSLAGLGNVAFDQGDSPTARSLYQESLAILQVLGHRHGMAVPLNGLGNIAFDEGDYRTAGELYNESLAIMRDLGDPNGTAGLLNALGNIALEKRDHSTAGSLYEECLAIKRQLGDQGGMADALNNLGLLAYEKGDYLTARARYEASLAIRRELADSSGIAVSLGNLGNAALAQGEFTAAQALHQECLAIRRRLGSRRDIASSLAGLARVLDALGNSLRAARIWGAAERLREQIGSVLSPTVKARYELRVAACRAALGDDAGFDRAWKEGHTMTLEQAIELALAETVERS